MLYILGEVRLAHIIYMIRLAHVIYIGVMYG